MNITELQDEHLERALYYSEGKLLDYIQKYHSAEHNISIFKQKRSELLEEAEKRGLDIQSNTQTDPNKSFLLSKFL